MTQSLRPRVLNLTPHDLHIFIHPEDKVPITIPSDGDLRLRSESPNSTLSHVHPLHYYRSAMGQLPEEEAAISVIHAQVFVGLDVNSPGYKLLGSLTKQDSIIVSMPVAQWIVKHIDLPCKIFSPGTGPSSVVRFEDEEPSRKGQIKGVRALEYHEKTL